MRFSVAIQPQPQPPLRTPAVAEVIRRLISNDPAPRSEPTARAEDLPIDLDQRVRLIGEW